MPAKLLMIDNYDSFTYNLVQYFSALDCEVIVYRNDDISISEIRTLHPDYIVISPGPCTPDEAGISLQVITELGQHYPILGVCLGHQSIAQAFGGKVVHAPHIMHGKVSEIIHDGTGLYEGVPSPLTVTRYHSLVAEVESLPDCLLTTALVNGTDSATKVVMSFSHKNKPIYGVQYHPESILTQHGKKILKNFLRLGKKHV